MSDIVVGVTPQVQATQAQQKPAYVVALAAKDSKGKDTKEFFMLSDKPDIEASYISCKGFFVSGTEEEIANDFQTILTQTDKRLHCNIMFPWARVLYIKNLAYKAK